MWSTARKKCLGAPSQVPILLHSPHLPKTIRGYLQPAYLEDVIKGTALFFGNSSFEVHSPLLLGSLTSENVPHKKAPTDPQLSKKDSIDPSPFNECDDSKFKLFIVDGTCFPMGENSNPAGFGHTLIFDPHHSCVRKLSTLACWLLAGCSLEAFHPLPKTTEQWGPTLLHFNPLAFCSYVLSLVLGIFLILNKTCTTIARGDVSRRVSIPRKHMPRRNLCQMSRLEQIPRTLAYLRRHGMEEGEIEVFKDGWAPSNN